MTLHRHGLAASAAVLLLTVFTACAPRPEDVLLTGPTMGTTYHVTVVTRDADQHRDKAQRCVDAELAAVEESLSTYVPESEISSFNRSESGEWQPVSNPFYTVLEAAGRISRETGGTFDITIAPLARLWGFGSGVGSAGSAAPSPEFVHDATATVGHRWLELRAKPNRAARKARMPLELDVNGIAPGYAVDRIVDCLAHAGLRDHLVEIGGEVRASGQRIDGRPWQVAVEAPLAGERRPYAGLQLTNLAVSTSGSYRESRPLPGGRTISHLIDPRTGEPVRHGLVSVTVVHPRAMDADAYATALLVAGPEEGYQLALRLRLAALLLERTETPGTWREQATPGFDRLRRPVD